MSEESKNNLGSLGDMQVITETENKQDTNPETEVSGENKSETAKTEEPKNENNAAEPSCYQDFLNAITSKELRFTAEVLMSALVKMERNDNNKDVPLDKFHDYVFEKHHDEFYEIIGKKKQDEKKLDGKKPLETASIEELQAMLDKKKEEALKPKFELCENDPSNLAKFAKLYRDNLPEVCPLLNPVLQFSEILSVICYPGKLTKFCKMFDKNHKPVNNKDSVVSIELFSTYENVIIDRLFVRDTLWFDEVLAKL